jgi:hypothetical protein
LLTGRDVIEGRRPGPSFQNVSNVEELMRNRKKKKGVSDGKVQ